MCKVPYLTEFTIIRTLPQPRQRHRVQAATCVPLSRPLNPPYSTVSVVNVPRLENTIIRTSVSARCVLQLTSILILMSAPVNNVPSSCSTEVRVYDQNIQYVVLYLNI